MSNKIGKVGITGGIGSGKTTVTKLFALLNIPIYYADIRASMLMNIDPEIIKAVKQAFGADVYNDLNVLNRKLLAKRAFKDIATTEKLNQIVHPAVGRDFNAWAEEQHQVPYVLKEAALTFESGSDKYLDKIITVFAPLYLRIERAMKRDNATQKDIEARIDKQMPEEEKIKKSDYVIYNDGSQMLIPQVLAIHQKLLENFKSFKIQN